MLTLPFSLFIRIHLHLLQFPFGRIEEISYLRSIFLSVSIYHLICLTGLAYQVSQISINCFMFPTISSIEFNMPGKQKIKAINVCVLNEHLDYKKYSDLCDEKGVDDMRDSNVPIWDKCTIVSSYLIIKERFYVTNLTTPVVYEQSICW